MNPFPTASDNASADLSRLQQELLRARVARARRLTEDQRLSEAFALTNGVLRRMHEGVMAEPDTADAATGWQEIRRRMERLRSVRARSVSPPDNAATNSS
ncbi:MAG: hypothetical protein ACKOHG_02165 [Planctomycetia bacterium]